MSHVLNKLVQEKNVDIHKTLPYFFKKSSDILLNYLCIVTSPSECIQACYYVFFRDPIINPPPFYFQIDWLTRKKINKTSLRNITYVIHNYFKTEI